MKYQVVVKNKVVKEYPYRIQAVVWCFLRGYGYQKGNGSDRWIIGAEIKEVKDSLGKCDKSHIFRTKNVKG